ncbi:MAG: hypothetical protein JRG73_08810 [Deltaproteobacteria bacterium]|nr:hypothetical protein [Deltaproteobacteria bacterium]
MNKAKLKAGVLFRAFALSIILGSCMITGNPGFMTGLAYAQNQTLWSQLPDIDSSTSPVIFGHSDGSLHAVGIAFNGIAAYTSTSTPGGWGPWQIIGPQPTGQLGDPAFYTNPDTRPVLIQDGNTLYLLVRGHNDNLYETHKTGGGNWSSWQQLTTDGPVRGRLSVALTRPAVPVEINERYIHVLYKSVDTTVEYRRFLISAAPWTQSGTAEQWSNAVEGTIGTDGTNQLLAVIRGNDRKLLVQKKLYPWNATWKHVFWLTAEGDQGDFFDISSVVYLGGAFHVVYAKKFRPDDVSPVYTHQLQHFRIPLGQQESGYFITSYDPQVTDPDGNPIAYSHPQTELIVYRNKLVMAYRDPWGWIRYARWDNAGPFGPWIGGGIIDGSRRTEHRPALGVLDRRPFITPNAAWAAANFGHDLFAAITDITTDAIMFVNFSRAIFTKEIDAQFAVYNSNSDGLDPVCRDQNEPFAPTLIPNIGQDGRPFFTELGYVLWTLPHWFVGTLYKRAGTIGCQAGNSSGRFDPQPTCDETRYPVIIISQGGAGICNGVWVWRGDVYSWNIFHELTHTMSGMLGFSDDNNLPPTAIHETRSGIPLSALSTGFNLFGSRVNSDCLSNSPTDSCPDTRPAGFTGYGNNYDMSTRQHSFIGTLYFYFVNGSQLRQQIQDDLQNGDTLLQQKYKWIRKNIFSGVEFTENNRPLNDQFEVPSSWQQVLDYPPIAASTKSTNPLVARPIGVGSIAEGGDLLSLEVGTVDFTGPVDVYLAISHLLLGFYMITPGFEIQDLAAGIAPFVANTNGPINSSLFGDIPISWLPSGRYDLLMAITPAGELEENLYLWTTHFDIP